MPLATCPLPPDCQDAVSRALGAAFGSADLDAIEPLTGGLSSALVYRVSVGGRSGLLRVIRRNENPTRHFTCMQTAADAGLAPRVRYTSVEDRICVTDFVEAVPLPLSKALVRLPAALRTLHALPPFPVAPFNTTCTFLLDDGPAVEDLVRKVRTASLLPEDERAELLTACERVKAAYPRRAVDRVSSHNDLFKGDNVLFDGREAWLVDWEAAFLNDRYADLATAASFVVTGDEEEAVYLREYFGRPPSEEERARFFLMRQLVHAFYAMVYVWMASMAGAGATAGGEPGFREFHRRLWAGEVRLDDPAAKAAFGLVHWRRLRGNLRGSRFAEAVEFVAQIP